MVFLIISNVMNRVVTFFDRIFYPDYKDNWDDQLFREEILAYIDAKSVLLDLGAGAGVVKEMNFKGLSSRVCGVDLDKRVLVNHMLDEGKVADASKIPYPDSMFDLVFSDNLMEHVDSPQTIYVEVCRVLKPGGYFLFKTPNKYHYMPVAARLTPHKFHQWFNALRGRKTVDTFPTRYQSNSRGDIKDIGLLAGFSAVQVKIVEGRPEYLRISSLTYVLGIIYEKIVNSSELFSPLRILIIAKLQKSK